MKPIISTFFILLFTFFIKYAGYAYSLHVSNEVIKCRTFVLCFYSDDTDKYITLGWPQTRWIVHSEGEYCQKWYYALCCFSVFPVTPNDLFNAYYSTKIIGSGSYSETHTSNLTVLSLQLYVCLLLWFFRHGECWAKL